MLLSALCVRAARWCSALLLIVALTACGAGGSSSTPDTGNSGNVVDTPPGNGDASTHALSLSVSGDGYVMDWSDQVDCGSGRERCRTDDTSVQTLDAAAIAHFGSRLVEWQDNHSDRSRRDITIQGDTRINVSFERQSDIPDFTAQCSQSADNGFRALHLGDSLTAGFFLYFADKPDISPAIPLIGEYARRFDPQSEAPVVIAEIGRRISGDNVNQRAPSADIAALEAEHYWQQKLAAQSLEVGDFSTAVVALGSNDINDLIAGASVDDVIEKRVRPLLAWLGDKPVFWVLPHYSHWPLGLQGMQFFSSSQGFGCSCSQNAGGSAGTSPACQLHEELVACSNDAELVTQTELAFRAIYTLRARLAQLQDEYPNLIVVDPATAIAAASGDHYDLYQTMAQRLDSVHFSLQGNEWFAWLQSYLANHANPACALQIMPWQMPDNEREMGDALQLP